MNYTETKKQLDAIRSKYSCTGDIIFRIAIQYIVDYGRDRFNDSEWFEFQMQAIDKRHDEVEAKGMISWCTRDFEKAILECAKELAEIEAYDFLTYIQQEVWLGGGDIGKPDYQRAIKLIQGCMNWIETSSTSTSDLRDTLTNWCDFHEDEIEYLGYGYVFDIEDEEE